MASVRLWLSHYLKGNRVAQQLSLTCQGLDVGRTHTLPAMETVQGHQVSVVRFQVRENDVILITA